MYKLEGTSLLAASPMSGPEGFQRCNLLTGKWEAAQPTQPPRELAQIYRTKMGNVDLTALRSNTALEQALQNKANLTIAAVAGDADNWTAVNTPVFNRLGLRKPEGSTVASTPKPAERAQPRTAQPERTRERTDSAAAAPIGQIRIDNDGTRWIKVETGDTITRGSVTEKGTAWAQVDAATGEPARIGLRITDETMDSSTKQIERRSVGVEAVSDKDIRQGILPELRLLLGSGIDQAVEVRPNPQGGSDIVIVYDRLPVETPASKLSILSQEFRQIDGGISRKIINRHALTLLQERLRSQSAFRSRGRFA